MQADPNKALARYNYSKSFFLLEHSKLSAGKETKDALATEVLFKECSVNVYRSAASIANEALR